MSELSAERERESDGHFHFNDFWSFDFLVSNFLLLLLVSFSTEREEADEEQKREW